METTMRLAIETYAKLSNVTFDEALDKMQNNEIVRDIIVKMMFCVL